MCEKRPNLGQSDDAALVGPLPLPVLRVELLAALGRRREVARAAGLGVRGRRVHGLHRVEAHVAQDVDGDGAVPFRGDFGKIARPLGENRWLAIETAAARAGLTVTSAGVKWA